MNIEEQWTMAKLVERLKKIPLNISRLDKTIKIGTLDSPMVHLALMTFLRAN